MGLTPGSKLLSRWLSRFSLIALSALCFPVLSSAAHKRRKFHYDLFVEGGGSLYQGEASTVSLVTEITSTSANTSAYISNETVQDSGRLIVGSDFWFTRHDALQASYSYARADISATTIGFLYPSGSPLPSTSFTVPLGGHFLSFDYLRSFTLSRHWSFLLEAGVGGVWWHADSRAYRNFSANLGAGIIYRLTRHWAVRAEYRDYMERFPISGDGMLHDHSPTIGLLYRF